MDTKKYEDQMPVDEGLQGNETIEEAILALQQEPTEEILAHTLTVIRRRDRTFLHYTPSFVNGGIKLSDAVSPSWMKPFSTPIEIA